MDLTSIPERGTLYALYLDKVKYEKYSRKELLEDRQLTEKLLELHWEIKKKNQTKIQGW